MKRIGSLGYDVWVPSGFGNEADSEGENASIRSSDEQRYVLGSIKLWETGGIDHEPIRIFIHGYDDGEKFNGAQADAALKLALDLYKAEIPYSIYPSKIDVGSEISRLNRELNDMGSLSKKLGKLERNKRGEE